MYFNHLLKTEGLYNILESLLIKVNLWQVLGVFNGQIEKKNYNGEELFAT